MTIIAIMVALVAALIPTQMPAQGCNLGDFGCLHAEYHHWYQTAENGHPLMRPDFPAQPCCGNDCRPTKAKQDPASGAWSALIDGRWVRIPESKIKTVHADGRTPLVNPSGMAHICATPNPITIYCFVPPDTQI
jgi:hypothetical protein